jgi:hypothetical protein
VDDERILMFDVNDPAQKEFVDRFLAAIKGYADSGDRDLAQKMDVLFDLVAGPEERFTALKSEIEELRRK